MAGDSAAQSPLEGPPQRRPVGLVDEHGLDEHRQILVPRRVPVRLTDDAGDGSGDPADEKCGHVRLLPHGQIVAEDDRHLRRELYAVTLAARRPVELRLFQAPVLPAISEVFQVARRGCGYEMFKNPDGEDLHVQA
jgi:hypothetical protein